MSQTFDVFADFATNPALEVGGSWFDLGKGARVLVARADNRNYNRALNKALETHQEALARQDDSADELSNRVMAEVFAKAVLLGFEGIFYKGQAMSFSYDNALTLLMHQDFRVLIGKKASQFDAYKAKVEDEQGKA